ncbi:helix-turn-helix domain-containing protein [Streptomyces sp. NPDC096311]|uniref:helix-turn-helix domain-containing protein n=1 Tax=Streptomyces sp. NPDC096311 TaxID=3366083 RepID=UPI00381F720E
MWRWDQGNRCVPALRREEVAFLAGISSDYYNRLAQGHDRNPSEQVLRSIARALRLDDEATTYLLEIATRKSPRRKRPRRPEQVSDGLRTLWARQDVKHNSTGTSLLRHPEAGPLGLHYENLLVPGTGGQTLVTYHAQPGSASEERLRLLASVHAPDRVGGTRPAGDQSRTPGRAMP